MRIAITGSSGMVGSALRSKLETGGHEIVRIRHGHSSNPNAEWSPADRWLREGVLEGVDVVVHLAGASIGDRRWSTSYKQEMRASRIDGATLLVNTIREMSHRPRALVTSSAVGFYGNRDNERLTEDAGRGSGFLADLVADWEDAARSAEDLGLRVAMVRSGIVLRSMLPALITPFKLGLGGRLGSGKQYFPWVGLEDLVRIYEHAITGDVSGPINAVAPEDATNNDFTRDLGKAIRRPTLFPLPGFMLGLIMGGEKARETGLISQRVIPQRLVEAGLVFSHPTLKEALPSELAAI
ncbi:MAG: TIGR01777 family oxidoreductase [Acidobacteria bacterium]|nr:TIGR01777 family oxidoreductase [Acidobacteriota bacterium]